MLTDSSLTSSDLESYEAELHNPENTAKELFSKLKTLYQHYFHNMQTLAMITYGIELILINEEHQANTSAWNKKDDLLRQQGEFLLQRINDAQEKVEQQFPEHAEQQEQLIAELEQVSQQREQYLESAKELSASRFRLDQQQEQAIKSIQRIREDATAAITLKQEEFQQLLKVRYKRVQMKSKLLTLIPLLGFPFLLDYFSQYLETSATASKTLPHLLQGHYIFFISFLLLELFLIDKLKDKLSHYFAATACRQSFDHLQELFSQNKKDLNDLEQTHHITATEVAQKLNSIT